MAMRMKSFLVAASYSRKAGQPSVAYNLAEDDLCAVIILAKKRGAKMERRQLVGERVRIRQVEKELPKQKRAVEEVTVVASGTYVGVDYPLVRRISTPALSFSHAE